MEVSVSVISASRARSRYCTYAHCGAAIDLTICRQSTQHRLIGKRRDTKQTARRLKQISCAKTTQPLPTPNFEHNINRNVLSHVDYTHCRDARVLISRPLTEINLKGGTASTLHMQHKQTQSSEQRNREEGNRCTLVIGHKTELQECHQTERDLPHTLLQIDLAQQDRYSGPL